MPNPEDMNRDEIKEIIKEAVREWLDKQVQKFGWWSLKTLACLGLVALIWLILLSHGLSIKL